MQTHGRPGTMIARGTTFLVEATASATVVGLVGACIGGLIDRAWPEGQAFALVLGLVGVAIGGGVAALGARGPHD